MLKYFKKIPKALTIECFSFLKGKEVIEINEEVKDEFLNNLIENTFWKYKIFYYDDIMKSMKTKK